MATQQSLERIQQIFIAYYGRPADPAGREFWANELDAVGGNLNAIIDAFAASDEFAARFGELTGEQLINNLFLQAFGRVAEAAGLAFFLDQLDTGRATLGNIALLILDSAQKNDATVIANKELVAGVFTAQVEATGANYSGIEAGEAAKVVLDAVTSDAATVGAQIKAGNLLIDNLESPDLVAPMLASTSPADGGTEVALNTNLVLTFDEDVQAGTGTIVITDSSDGSDIRSIDVGDDRIAISGNTVTISPDLNLEGATNYSVQIGSTAIRDLAGNAYAGIVDITSFNFTTASLDQTAPGLSSVSPLDGDTDVLVGANIVLTFDEDVQAGTGSIEITDTVDASDSRMISITDPQVSISDNVITINLSNDLEYTTNYTLEIDAGVIVDLADIPFAGIGGVTNFNFVTADPPPPPASVVATVNPADTLTLFGAPPAVVVDLTQASAGDVVTEGGMAVDLVETVPWDQAAITTLDASEMEGSAGLTVIIQQSDAGDLESFSAPRAGSVILALKDTGDFSGQSVDAFDFVNLTTANGSVIFRLPGCQWPDGGVCF